MDYPSPEDFLASMFASTGHSNTSGYRSSAFDAKLNQAGTASSLDAAGQYYEEAETIIAEDMPVIPLWYPSIAVLHSSNVTAARVDAFGLWDYSSLRPA